MEAVKGLKEDFAKRNLDESLILEVGENYVILSSGEKINTAALITLGVIEEPVSLDGCESHAKDYLRNRAQNISPCSSEEYEISQHVRT